MKKIHPFSCGTQYEYWVIRNCEQCKKGYDYEKLEHRCEIQKELDLACAGTGGISEEIARRMGYFKHKDEYTWRCPEFEPKSD